MAYNFLIVIAGSNKHGILKSRLDKCAELFKKRTAHKIIVTGRGESKSMKDYLIKKGIPGKIIFSENHSTDTFGNAFFSKLLFVLENKWNNLAVVTSDFHRKRASFIFKRIFGRGYKLKFFEARTKVNRFTWG